MPLCVVRCTPEPSVQEVIWISNLDIGTYHLTRPLPSICVSPRSLYLLPLRWLQLTHSPTGRPDCGTALLSPPGLCTTALPTS